MIGTAAKHARDFGVFFGYILEELILKMVHCKVLGMPVKFSMVIVMYRGRSEHLGVRCVNRYNFRKISIQQRRGRLGEFVGKKRVHHTVVKPLLQYFVV